MLEPPHRSRPETRAHVLEIDPVLSERYLRAFDTLWLHAWSSRPVHGLPAELTRKAIDAEVALLDSIGFSPVVTTASPFPAERPTTNGDRTRLTYACTLLGSDSAPPGYRRAGDWVVAHGLPIDWSLHHAAPDTDSGWAYQGTVYAPERQPLPLQHAGQRRPRKRRRPRAAS